AINAMEVSKATLHARKEVNAIVNALRSNGGVWKNIRLVATSEQIGIREGRRIHGLYTVSEDDLVKGARFDDAVCRVSFGVDVHSVSKDDETPKGDEKESHEKYNRGIKSKDYDIPLRSLIAKDIGGLMMAGRCISGDFIAHSSYRVTGNAVIMGQAAGRVSALASAKNILPQDLDFKSTGL
ncbi:MAG TPA: FAD-dependent oxidoreductase, partial [Membranihabitans sp.]|nr:FAD-dependent oxidoreductase [Membranihabitans sp.]